MGSETIGILTQDPALYGELAQFFHSRKVSVMSLIPGRQIPSRVGVVVTSETEARELRFSRTVVARPGHMVEAWASVQIALREDPTTRTELVVGVDPGQRPGYAVLAGSRCVASGVVESPEAVALIGVRLRQTFPDSSLVFRVGNGDRVRQVRTVNALLQLHVPVELVDEHETTLRGRRSNDPLSAKAIATTPGRRISRKMDLRVTEGEIANLQRLSREQSGGRLTIPRGVASAVLSGEMSLGEALETTARAKKVGSSGPH